MRDGAVIEHGTHEELLAAKGHYHQLWTVQGLAEDVKVNKEKSENKDVVETEKESEETDFYGVEQHYEKNVFSKLMAMNRPESLYILIGCIGALIAGSIEPLFALALTEYINLFSEYPFNSPELADQIMKWSLGTIGIGLILCVAVIIDRV